MYKLPRGWAETNFGNLAEYINGAAFKPTDWQGSGVPIIRIQNLTNKEKPLNRTNRILDQRYKIKKGDILFSWSATLDAFIWDREDAWLNQHIFKVVPKPKIAHDKFLYYLLREKISEIVNSEHLHGSTMKHINRGPFLAHKINLPPANEQKRIAKKLDLLNAHSSNAREELTAVPRLIERYKQAILSAAFSGKLIQSEMKGWHEKELGEISNTKLGKMLDKNKNKGKSVPYLRNINVRWGEFDLSDLFEMKFTDDELEKFSIKDGDLMICEGGEPGRCAVWSGGDTHLKYQKAIHRVRLKNGISSQWIALQFWLYYHVGRLEPYYTGSTIKHLTKQSLEKVPFVIAPEEEQRKILSLIKKAFASMDAIATQTSAGLRQLSHLEAQCLNKAFRGELVPQDPNDEPASVLIERIRTKTASAVPAKKAQKKAVKKKA